MVEKLMKLLALGKDEGRVYACLLDGRAVTAGDIATKLSIPRSSAYEILKHLRNRGVATQTIKRGVRYFEAEAPRNLGLLFEKKVQDVQKDFELFQTLIPLLESKRKSKTDQPKLQFFEGAEGVKNIFMDTLLYRDITTYSFWPVRAAVELLSPEFMHYHIQQRIQNRLFIQGIWPQSQVISIKKYPYMGPGAEYYREVRVAPPEVDFSMSFWVYANKTAFMSSRRESYGFVIESTELAEMLTSLHQVVWRLSKPLVAT